MELLAPAGSYEAFLAAVNNGANAVYLAAKSFGARAYAANFSFEELAEALKYAHLRGVRVFVTMNTLMNDEELPAAIEQAKELYRLGVDALIIQDWGFFNLLKELLPEFELHASTQMTLHNQAGVDFGAERGFARLILSREMRKDDLESICENTEAEIEVFVHGALCICYSGRCLFSSMVGGRSGNRGRCAQPCRLKYKLLADGKPVQEGHLLSPRDLKLWEMMPELEEMGVASAKLEGRMKRPEYVAAVVGAYADPADENGAEVLRQSFNRDFTTGYLWGDPGKNLMSWQRPSNRGVKLGRITAVEDAAIRIKLDDELNLGDGLEIWVSKGGRQGFTVDKIALSGLEVENAKAGQEVLLDLAAARVDLRFVRPGDRVFKTADSRLQAASRETLVPNDLPLEFVLTAKIGEPLVILARALGEEACWQSDFIVPKAEKRPSDKAMVEEQLSRTGGTGWRLENLIFDADEGIMLPKSVLNEARRQVIAALEDKLLAAYKQLPVNEKRLPRLAPIGKQELQLAVKADSLSVAEAAQRAGVEIIYLDRAAKEKIDWQRAAKLAKKAKVYALLPETVNAAQYELFKNELAKYAEAGLAGIVCGNPWAVQLAQKEGYAGELLGDAGLNVFNSHSIDFWQSEGVKRLMLSPELSLKQIKDLKATMPLEVQVFGSLQLMVSEHCVLGAVVGGKENCKGCSRPCDLDREYELQDEKGYRFPLKQDRFCRSRLYNAHLLCLLEDWESLSAAGVGVLRLDLAGFGEGLAGEVCREFRRALQSVQAGIKVDAAEMRDHLSALTGRKLTKGHFFRGVE